jgi:hypothetical protein
MDGSKTGRAVGGDFTSVAEAKEYAKAFAKGEEEE